MFIKISGSTRNGKTHKTVQIAESYRTKDGKVRHRILLHLGPLDKFLEKDVEKLINSLLRLKNLTSESLEGDIDGVKDFGQIWALMHLWKELKMSQIIASEARKRNIQFDLEAHLKALTFNRLDDPGSKLKLLTWLETVHIPGVNKDTIKYEHLLRAMDFLIEHKKAIEQKIARRFLTLFNQDLKVCLYDLTSTYFEADASLVEDDIRRHGYSRDHRPDREQIVIGVVMTGDGIPIAHYVFPGNTVDRSTLFEMLADIRKRFRVERVQVVADKGFMSGKNLGKLLKEGYEFILGESTRQGKDAREVLEEAYAHREKSGESVYETVRERSLKLDTGEIIEGPIRYIASFNEETKRKRFHNRISRLKSFYELVDEILAKRISNEEKFAQIKEVLARKHLKRFIKVQLTEDGIKIEQLDRELEAESRRDGWFLVISNDRSSSNEDIVRRYKDLRYVEHSFHELKHSLKLRPNFHWTEKRIRAHVMVCFIAFQMAVLFEKRLVSLNITWERAMEKLRRVKVVEWENKGRNRRGLTKVHAEQLTIFQAIGAKKPTILSL